MTDAIGPQTLTGVLSPKISEAEANDEGGGLTAPPQLTQEGLGHGTDAA